MVPASAGNQCPHVKVAPGSALRQTRGTRSRLPTRLDFPGLERVREDTIVQYDGGYYRDIAALLGERYLDYGFTQGTAQEVDFLVDLFALPTGAALLDLGCGPGRHAVELARRGFAVTGIDISPTFIEIARERAAGLPATFICQDARESFPAMQVDAVYCLCEGAFGLAGSEAGHRQILGNVRNVLKTGGQFVLSAFSGYGAARRSSPNDEFDPETGIVTSRETITGPDGAAHAVEMFTTTFTPRELTSIVESEGFTVEALWGCHPGRFARRPLELDDYEMLLVARHTE